MESKQTAVEKYCDESEFQKLSLKIRRKEYESLKFGEGIDFFLFFFSHVDSSFLIPNSIEQKMPICLRIVQNQIENNQHELEFNISISELLAITLIF